LGSNPAWGIRGFGARGNLIQPLASAGLTQLGLGFRVRVRVRVKGQRRVNPVRVRVKG